jgi:2Fe-2S ferredoxin
MPRVRFLPEGYEVEVSNGATLLEAAGEVHAQVGSACGGKCACSTCHLYVREGASLLSEKDDREEDRLDMAFDVRPSSRLGCQAEIKGGKDALVVVEITRESRQAWLDEHPAERKKLEHPPADPPDAEL